MPPAGKQWRKARDCSYCRWWRIKWRRWWRFKWTFRPKHLELPSHYHRQCLSWVEVTI